MSNTDEPQSDWSLLPHDPAAFFGLSDPIDRRDLKRAYNRLLRRFKPEKAPAEFQRIRAAYEALDERLRYGDQMGPIPHQPAKWEEAPSEPSTAEPQPAQRERKPRSDRVDRTPIPKRKSLAERLETESPQALYRELSAIEKKNPFEYYALAVLSDVVEKQRPLRFAEWLLSALKAHPDDGSLWRLLHEYLRGPLPEGAEEKLLPAIAKLSGGDFFYPLTEPLWLNLVRRDRVDAMEQFASLLQECERHLRDVQIQGRITFYIQLAKAAFFAAPHAWPEQALNYVEENFEQVPAWLEMDIDILGLMREYAAVREPFREGHALRKRLDEALRAYFTEEQQIGDRAVLACHVAVSEDLAGLQQAFPLNRNDWFQPFYTLWQWVNWDVAARHAPPDPEATGPQPDWMQRVRALLVQLQRSSDASRQGWAWGMMAIGRRALQGAALFGITTLAVLLATFHTITFDRSLPDAVNVLLLIAAFGIGVYLGFRMVKKIDNRYYTPYCQDQSMRMYEAQWRPAILQFQQRTHLDGQEFRNYFDQSVYQDLSYSGYVCAYVQQDFAPAMLAIAQRFQS